MGSHSSVQPVKTLMLFYGTEYHMILELKIKPTKIIKLNYYILSDNTENSVIERHKKVLRVSQDCSTTEIFLLFIEMV